MPTNPAQIACSPLAHRTIRILASHLGISGVDVLDQVMAHYLAGHPAQDAVVAAELASQAPLPPRRRPGRPRVRQEAPEATSAEARTLPLPLGEPDPDPALTAARAWVDELLST